MVSLLVSIGALVALALILWGVFKADQWDAGKFHNEGSRRETQRK